MASSTTRIIRTNWATQASGRVISNVPNADPDGPAANMLLPDRYTVWKAPSTTSEEVFVVNLGASRVVDYLGLSNLVRSSAGGGIFPNSFYVNSYANYPNPVVTSCTATSGSANVTRGSGSFVTDGVKVGMYVLSPVGPFVAGQTVLSVAALTVVMSAPAATTTTTSFTFSDMAGTVLPPTSITGLRDVIKPITRTSRKFWEFHLNLNFGFALGAPVIGFQDTDTDQGIAWSPGSSRTRQRNAQEYRTAGGAPSTIRLGEDVVRWSLQFENRLKASVDALENAMHQDPTVLGYPFLLDPWDQAHQVRPTEWTVDHVFGAGSYDLMSATLALEKLP